MVEFGADGVMKWERVTPPLWWPAADAHIVADRFLPNGTRQHMVTGHVQSLRIISNAEIIGEADMPNAEFSATWSHLAK